MGERYVRIVEVVGSSPICSTIKPRWFASGAFLALGAGSARRAAKVGELRGSARLVLGVGGDRLDERAVAVAVSFVSRQAAR